MLTKFRTGMALCLAAATFGASGARAQLPDDYSRHVVAAKNASLFDWTGVFARICVAPKTVLPSAITAPIPAARSITPNRKKCSTISISWAPNSTPPGR